MRRSQTHRSRDGYKVNMLMKLAPQKDSGFSSSQYPHFPRVTSCLTPLSVP